VIVITDGVTRIEVNADEIPRQTPAPEQRHATGARVTVAFARQTPIPSNREIRLLYDIADNGDLRDLAGVPLFTQTTTRQGLSGASYHYRMSHWIPAASVMQFVPRQWAPNLRRNGPWPAGALSAAS